MNDRETLLEAAMLMRERADAAVIENDWKRGIAKLGRLTPKGQHMASWRPGVAYSVASLLESVAQTDLGRGMQETHDDCDEDCDVVRAVNVARTYLQAVAGRSEVRHA